MAKRGEKFEEHNIEWTPQDDEEYPYIPPITNYCNTDTIKAKDKFADPDDQIEVVSPYEDWGDVYHETINVHLSKPPKGENKDRTPGAKAKPSPWSLPDKVYGDVLDKRHGTWTGSRSEVVRKVIFPWEKKLYGAVEDGEKHKKEDDNIPEDEKIISPE